ncbi:alpha/beta hydrolase [Microbulbifer sp. ALW1]|uniref:alpha/beta hydrolase n=1 Tax=Microbulbifer sp. (strain ALW1) TaxID=1516059 RepID=UPI00135B5E70|nr:alpha/beta hydrolase [Microbulbifer sp. ALW1]
MLQWSTLPVIALLLVLLLLPPVASAGKRFPVDDSFNVNSAFAKAHKQYPAIEIARVEPAAGTQVRRNLVYRRIESDERALHLDLFLPSVGAALQPAVLLVHGGGWRSGNRTLQEPMAIYLANRGFVTATVEYRLSLEAQYPAGMQDLKSALGWLRLNADKYGIDPARIAVLGASSGAQMATLVGVTPGMEAFATVPSRGRDSVQAIVNLDGVVSFITPMALKFENDPRKNPSAAGAWFGGRFEEVPDLWRQASPLEYAGAGSPPTLFINSSHPRFHAGRDQYIARLAVHDIPSEVVTHDDSPHPFWLFQPWFNPTAERVADFLQRQLK